VALSNTLCWSQVHGQRKAKMRQPNLSVHKSIHTGQPFRESTTRHSITSSYHQVKRRFVLLLGRVHDGVKLKANKVWYQNLLKFFLLVMISAFFNKKVSALKQIHLRHTFAAQVRSLWHKATSLKGWKVCCRVNSNGTLTFQKKTNLPKQHVLRSCCQDQRQSARGKHHFETKTLKTEKSEAQGGKVAFLYEPTNTLPATKPKLPLNSMTAWRNWLQSISLWTNNKSV